MCPKVTSQYKTEVSEKIVQATIIAFSRYEYDRTKMDDIAETASWERVHYTFTLEVKKTFLCYLRK